MIFHVRNELRNLDFQGCRIITEQDVKRQNGPKITQGQQTPKNLSQYYIFFSYNTCTCYMNAIMILGYG